MGEVESNWLAFPQQRAFWPGFAECSIESMAKLRQHET
jgi:hypothetical protein